MDGNLEPIAVSERGNESSAMTYVEISDSGISNGRYPTSEHYVAEYLYQNQTACYWSDDTENNVIYTSPIPEPPSDAIALPPPSGGDDTSALESVINSNSGGSFVGSGTYRLSDLTVDVPSRIWNVPSIPLSSTTGTIWTITSQDVRIYNSPIDALNSKGISFGWDVRDESHDFHLVSSGFSNAKVTDGGSMAGVFLRAVSNFHIACNLFENILNASGKGTTARANAIWMNGGGDGSTSCLLYTSPSPRDKRQSRMPSSA